MWLMWLFDLFNKLKSRKNDKVYNNFYKIFIIQNN